MNKPIEIFLRKCYHSPNSELPNRNRPEWFSKAKCYENLLYTASFNLSNINVVYDNFFGNRIIINKDYFSSYHEINAGTEAKSFLFTIDYTFSKNLPDDTVIYFLEDDYLHKPNWCEVLLEGVKLAPYVTLYDHKDKYLHYPDLTSKILVSESAHWRTTPSTTNTYACTFRQLKEDLEIHKQFSRDRDISDDNGKFLELGKMGRTLISSIPGYSTHCDDYLSPVVNWSGLG